MPVYHVQNVLNGGEISPLMRGRVDQPRYSTGTREMLNFVPMPQGGATRRPGTRYLGTACHEKARLIPFVFSATQGRMLEFGDHVMRVWLPDGTLVTKNGAVLEVETPFAAGDLAALRFAQSADVIYFAHASHAPCKVSRYADDDWRFSTLTFMPTIATPGKPSLSILDKRADDDKPANPSKTDYTYLITAFDADGVESKPSAESAVQAEDLNSVDYHIRISWTAVSGAEGYRIYKKKQGVFGFIGRASAGETSFDDKNIGADTEDTPPEYKNPFSGAGNYPTQVFFHQQRLGYAATSNRPITVWLSRTGEFENFASSTPPKDDDAIEVTLAATQASRIVWLRPDRTSLAFGTEGSEWILTPSEGVALTPSTVSFQLQTTSGGSDAVPAVSVNGSIVYVQRGSGAVREFAYSYSADKYLGQDMTILARHVVKDVEIVSWAFQQEPYSVLWCVLSDGRLAALTCMKEQEVMGWHRHETDGAFLDAAVIPGVPDDQLWFVVRRSGGVFVERMDNFFDSPELSEAYFLDCALNYLGAEASHFSGLSHLAGAKVQVFADGGTVDGLEVSASGELDLKKAASSVHVGLPYVSRLVPNLPEVQAEQGTSFMHNRRITAVRLRVYRSMSFMAGLEGGLVPVVDRHIRSGTFERAPFFSEGADLALDVCGGWSDESPLIIEVKSATPLTVLALLTVMEVSTYSGKGGF